MTEQKFTDTGIFHICSGISAYLFALLLALRLASLFSFSTAIILALSVLLFAALFVLYRKYHRSSDQLSDKSVFPGVYWGAVSTYAMQFFFNSEKSFIWLILFALISLFLHSIFSKVSVNRKILIYSSVLGSSVLLLSGQ